MKRKPSMPYVASGLRKKRRARKQMNLAGRRVDCDVLTPRDAPQVVRLRVATPLTPASVRSQMMENAEGKDKKNLRRKLTPLDRLLSTAEADALELWARIENEAGRVAVAQWNSDKVDTSRRESLPLPTKGEIRRLRQHARAKWALAERERQALNIFAQQMLGDRSIAKDADLAVEFGLCAAGTDAAGSMWRHFLRRIARILVRFYHLA